MGTNTYVGAIEAFKHNIPNIQRSSLFDVTIANFKYGVVRDNNSNGIFLKFAVRSATFPESAVGDTPVNYMGRQVHFYGNRTYGSDWQTTVIVDGNWAIYDDLYAWNQAMGGANRIVSENINSHNAFKVDAYITAYATDGTISRRSMLHGLWPKSVGSLSMDWSQDSALDLQVNWTYDYVTSDYTRSGNYGNDRNPTSNKNSISGYEGYPNYNITAALSGSGAENYDSALGQYTASRPRH